MDTLDNSLFTETSYILVKLKMMQKTSTQTGIT